MALRLDPNGVAGAIGAPRAFIIHHTAGRGTPQGVIDTLNQRGLGVQYIMDRDGKIYQVGGPGESQMRPGSGVGAGLSNANTVGMEVIAKDDSDVTPQQVAAAREFVNKTYPGIAVYGHGQVNPGHKQASEGMTIVNAIKGIGDGGGQAVAAATPAATPAAAESSPVAATLAASIAPPDLLDTPDFSKFTDAAPQQRGGLRGDGGGEVVAAPPPAAPAAPVEFAAATPVPSFAPQPLPAALAAPAGGLGSLFKVAPAIGQAAVLAAADTGQAKQLRRRA